MPGRQYVDMDVVHKPPSFPLHCPVPQSLLTRCSSCQKLWHFYGSNVSWPSKEVSPINLVWIEKSHVSKMGVVYLCIDLYRAQLGGRNISWAAVTWISCQRHNADFSCPNTGTFRSPAGVLCGVPNPVTMWHGMSEEKVSLSLTQVEYLPGPVPSEFDSPTFRFGGFEQLGVMIHVFNTKDTLLPFKGRCTELALCVVWGISFRVLSMRSGYFHGCQSSGIWNSLSTLEDYPWVWGLIGEKITKLKIV